MLALCDKFGSVIICPNPIYPNIGYTFGFLYKYE